MTRQQYKRWKDFARRMVNVAIRPRQRNPSRKDVLENIEFFFECRMEPDDEWKRVRNWDNTEATPDDQHPYCVGDHISSLAEAFIPGYWNLPDDEYEAAVERWVDPVHVCVRAGLDVAVAPSAGVSGFTVGDIRKMYPKGVPEWVRRHVVGDTSDKFEAIHDSDKVWL